MLIITTMKSLVRWSALVALLAAVIAIGQASVASAEEDCFDKNGKRLIICQEDPGGGEENPGGGDEGGGPPGPPPPCDLSGDFDFCEGVNACWIDISAIQDLEALENLFFPGEGSRGDDDGHPGPKLNEDDVLMYKFCEEPDGTPDETYYWAPPGAPLPVSLTEQARLAYGLLQVPDFSVEFRPGDMTEPTDLTYVGTDTSFWVAFDNPSDSGRIVGTRAITLNAVATPDYIEIAPGDGSAIIECPWALDKTDECVKTYLRSSATSTIASDDGLPAHKVDATLVYTVHFEQFGTPITIPGLDLNEFGTLEGTESTPVPVGEIQAIVTE